jgi:hypothetical protein
MPDYTGGYTSALNDISSRNLQKTQQQTMLESMTEKALTFQQQQQDKQDQTAAEKALVTSLPLLQTPQPDGPQPPPPGQSSQPMTPPPAGAAPPPMAGPPGGMPPPTAGMAPPGAPAPQGGMPAPAAAPMPPQGWKSSPAAPPHLGGPPQGSAQPGPSSGMPSPAGGLPPPQAGAAPPPAAPAPGGAPPMPGGAPGAGAPPGGMGSGNPSGIEAPKIIDPFKMAATLMKANPGMTPHQSALMLQQMWPMIDAQNKSAVDAYTRATKQAEDVVKYRQQLMREDQEQHKVDQGDQRLKQGEAGIEERSTHDRAMEKAAMIRANRTGGGGASATTGDGYDKLSDADKKRVDYYARQSLAGDYSWKTGLARGGGGTKMILQVENRVPALAEESGLTPEAGVANRAGMAAQTKALADRTKFVAASNQFVKNMSSQADLVEKYMTKGTAGGVPALNKWIQAGRQQVAGDPDVSALDTALRGLAREHQRIVTGVTSNAQLHAAAQQTADELLNKNQTAAQMAATIKVMREEADNAVKAGRDEVAEMKANMSKRPGNKGDAAQPPSTNGKGWKLMKDKHGNMAYVSPDRTQHEAVAAQ